MVRNVSPRYAIVGEDAMSAQRSAVPEAVLCTTTVDGHGEIRRRPGEIA